MTYSARIEGLKEFQALLRKWPEITKRHLSKAMNRTVITVENAVKLNTPVGVSGRLRNSWVSDVREIGSSVVGEVGSSLVREVYPVVVERGRRPGRMPPPRALERWVRLVLRVSQDQVRNVAFLVARAIGRRGTKGRFMLRDAVRESTDKIVAFFGDALEAVVNEVAKR